MTVEEADIKPEYVDLGLSVKWATFNVGATKPEEYGNYYAWGETEAKSVYTYDNYIICNGNAYSTLTKYNTTNEYGIVDNKTMLDPEDDVAHVKWGGTWRMPTAAEQDELRKYCTWIWTTINGVNGCLITSNISGYTNRSIFLPAAGSCESKLYNVGVVGYYWSSTLRKNVPRDAEMLAIYPPDDKYHYYFQRRFSGYQVRPVCP